MSPTVHGAMSAVTDATFAEKVLNHDKPVLVDFWAQWCPPCHMVAPVLEEIARERSDTLTIVKLNADENPATTRDYHVMSFPTLILFHNGQPVRSLVGAHPKTRLLAAIDDVLR
jgi:thioredoxin 1